MPIARQEGLGGTSRERENSGKERGMDTSETQNKLDVQRQS